MDTYMHDPLINRELLAALRLVHGLFGLVVLLLFLFQANLGLQIRRARRAKQPLPFSAIKLHRRSGPVFLALLAATYLFGTVLVLLGSGELLEHPLHLLVGSLVVAAGLAVLVLSRRIRGQDPHYRAPHVTAGLVMVALLFLQVFLGIGVLF